MGLLDSIEGAIREAEAGNMPDLVSAALKNTDFGGLNGIVARLQQAGLGREVESWLSTEANNLPITPEQLRSVLSDQHVQQIAHQFGLPVDQALQVLAQHLPTAVDQASPTGKLPAQA